MAKADAAAALALAPFLLRKAVDEKALLTDSRLQEVSSGFPRGAITEITGQSSSGRTTILHSLIATATRQGEVCAMIDCDDTFDPATAARSGAELERILWVQCRHRVDHAMKAADMVLHAGGFGVVVLDLCDASVQQLQRIPISYWYRFQRAVENTSTVLLLAGRHPQARTCAARQLDLGQRKPVWKGQPPFQLLEGVDWHATLRKPIEAAKSAHLRAVAVAVGE